MKNLTTAVLIVMLLLISYVVVFCTPEYFMLTATGYCPCKICCGEWADGLTFTGDIAGRGCIAIDHRVYILRLGQKVYVEGYGHGVCNDIGEAIKGWRIDLCFDTHEEAVEWGVQLVKVYVLEVK